MDVGKISFIGALSVIDKWNLNSKALVQFPTYYSATIGEDLQCNLILNNVKEELYCQVAWDWTLEIWGPVSGEV